jgi:pre-rRNA-processing protein IPI3
MCGVIMVLVGHGPLPIKDTTQSFNRTFTSQQARPRHPAMLTEQFVAAISASTKTNTGVTKDAGIFINEFQPLAAQRQVFKKSATVPNGIALSASHVFAAQADKAILHVYSREKGNQEAIVPFPERIHSIALAAQDSVLLLGTESGRILAWEVSRRPHAANTLHSL